MLSFFFFFSTQYLAATFDAQNKELFLHYEACILWVSNRGTLRSLKGRKWIFVCNVNQF